jgi:hypothetical protein
MERKKINTDRSSIQIEYEDASVSHTDFKKQFVQEKSIS